ncbi:MAG: hypothetical protein ACJ72G_14110 [Friedmanniella sp.]
MHARQPVPDPLLRLALCQDGVVTLEQAVGHGLTPAVVKRLCRQQQWRRLGRGVLWSGSGQPPWASWAWAAVLVAGDHARLGPVASGHLWGLGPAPAVIDVLLPYPASCTVKGPWRFVRETPGLRSPRSFGSPPRLPALDTVLDLAGAGSEADVVDVVTRAVQQRLVTTSALLDGLAGRQQHPYRRLLVELLAEVADGVESPLELHYLRDVERAHDLPEGRRNRYRAGLRYRSDVGYDDYLLLVELDGRLGHEGAGRFRDFRRDNEFALRSLVTLRYGWHDVVDRPCEVATQVADVLRSRGWDGLPTRCRRCRRVR